jgi:hypothetical protein
LLSGFRPYEADAKGDIERARKLAALVQALTTADTHAFWIVTNKDKRGTEEFEFRARAYREANQEVARAMKAASDASALPPGMQAPQVETPSRVWLMGDKHSSEVTKYTGEGARPVRRPRTGRGIT